MKVLSFITALLILSVPAVASFNINELQDFDGGPGSWTFTSTFGEAGWQASGGNPGGFYQLGQQGTVPAATYTLSKLSNEFTTSAAGWYTVCFDYKFMGYDHNECNFDLALVKVVDEETIFAKSSDSGIPAYDQAMWVDFCDSVFLDEATQYQLLFKLREDDGVFLDTEFHVDNVLVSGPVIPLPGALLMASIGTGLVGWFRRR